MVQTHKLLYSPRNKSKFRFIPSKGGYLGKFYSNLGYHWQNFVNNYQVYMCYNHFCYIILWVYAVLVVQYTYIIKNSRQIIFNVKLYYFAIYQSTKTTAYHHPSTIFPPIFKFKYFLTYNN